MMERSVEIFVTGLLLIVGVSHIVRPRAWVEFFNLLRDKGEPGAFIVAMLHLMPGLFIIALHPRWSGVAAIITLIGWGWTIKGSIYFIFPQVMPSRIAPHTTQSVESILESNSAITNRRTVAQFVNSLLNLAAKTVMRPHARRSE